MPIINLVWSGATDLENAIIGYELSYKIGTSWIELPFVSTTNGYGSYSFMATQDVTHTFRIRTKDAAQNYSPYKTLVVPIYPVFYISETSLLDLDQNLACDLSTPNINIYPASPTLNVGTFIYSDSLHTIPFDGSRPSVNSLPSFNSRKWKILTPQQENFGVTINSNGIIVSSSICNNTYNGLISTSTTSALQACNLTVQSNNLVYWDELLDVGTTLYTNSLLTTTLTAGFYRIYQNLNGIERDCIIKVNTSGVILTLNNYNPYCTFTNINIPTNPDLILQQ